jgi:Protein of unknown function (DUF2934)
MAKTRTSASPAAPKTRAAKKLPTQEQIALRAYHIYLERNGAPGDPHADWLRAEQELLQPKPKAKPRRKATVTPIAA